MKGFVVAGAVPVLATLSLAIFAGAEGQSVGATTTAASETCMTRGPVSGLNQVQARNARLIVAGAEQTAARGGADASAQSAAELVALVAAATESTLHNDANPAVPLSEQVPNDGDPPSGGNLDSVGLFQERSSWGPLTARMNPLAATRMFVLRLMRVPSWLTTPPSIDAQAVEVSAYPDRYAAFEAPARRWLEQIQTGTGAGVAKPGRSSLSECGADGLPPAAVGHIPPGSIPAGYTIPSTATDAERIAVTFALAQLGKPYVFGAAGPTAYDCSGLTMAAWAAAGVTLDHYTVAQWHEGTPVSRPSQLSPADLILIPGADGTLHPPDPQHVGMYIGKGYVIEAPQTGDVVKIVPLTEFGPVVAMRHIE